MFAGWVRGVAVDFGFGSLIEKFEERFGKRITTALLAVVGLGIFAGCVGLIAGNLIKPGIDLYNATNWPAFKDWLITQLIPTLLSLGLLFVLAHLLSNIGEEVYRRTIGRMLMRKRADAFVKRTIDEYREKITSEISVIGEQAEARANENMREMKERLMGELYDAMRMRDEALEVSKRTLDLLRPWFAEFENDPPEVAAEKARKMIEGLRQIREEQAAQAASLAPQRPVHNPDADKAE